MKYCLPLIFLLGTQLSHAEEVLLPIEVVKEPSQNLEINTSDTSNLIQNTPGAHVRAAGGIAGQPSINGLSNDRVNIRIDDAPVTSSCPNHMNSALTYVDAFKVSEMDIMAGISSVSYGGDSLGSSIIVKTMAPQFTSNDSIKKHLELATFYRSNNYNHGASIKGEVASQKYYFQYEGMDESAGRYKAGDDGIRVKDSIYNQNNQSLTIARKLDSGVVLVKASRANVPTQGFINQYMDMLDNQSDSGQIRYAGKLAGMQVESQLTHNHVEHYMNKIGTERSGSMPMYTFSDETNAMVKLGKEVSSEMTVKTGIEYNQYRLQDWWTPVTTTVSGMGPNTFHSISDGKRDRLGIFAEANQYITDHFSMMYGIRGDFVKMDTGDVSGYNSTSNSPTDANAFNEKDRKQFDRNLDIVLTGRYSSSHRTNFDLGYARKTRSPNMYERYAWAGSATNGTGMPVQMDMRMINWFGDGNGYVGDIGLRPEVAHTFKGEIGHSSEVNGDWNVRFSPYFTYAKDYIDADYLTKDSSGRHYLQFANHDAVLFGGNFDAGIKVLKNNSAGDMKISVLSSYVRGYRVDKKSDLYHMMPLNGTLRLEHIMDKWKSKLDLLMVNKKSTVSKLRREPETAGYVLLNLSSSYAFSKWAMLEVAVLNLLDKDYSQPLGGVDLVNFGTNYQTAVLGMGRSINTMVKFQF